MEGTGGHSNSKEMCFRMRLLKNDPTRQGSPASQVLSCYTALACGAQKEPKGSTRHLELSFRRPICLLCLRCFVKHQGLCWGDWSAAPLLSGGYPFFFLHIRSFPSQG